MPKLSVIIPIYNVEDYLKECLDSVLNQTFTDMEVICVDDGSTDASPAILEEYAKKDGRIKVISQKNYGVSRARNAAMEHITGEYTYFMDSDDVIELNAFETLYNIAEEKELDFVMFKIINFDETDEKHQNPYYDMEYLKEGVGENVFSHFDVDPHDVFRIAVTPASKFYRSSLISDIRFPTDLIFEDNAFFIESFFKAKRVYFYDEYLSNKRVRKGSITQTPDASFMDYIKISDILIDITKSYGLYDMYRAELYEKTIRNIFFRFTQVDDDVKDEFFRKIKSDFSAKNEEYSGDEKFQQSSDRIKRIFYEGIDSQTYREYELSINVYDLEAEMEKQRDRYDSRITHLKSKIDKLNNNVAAKKTEIKSLKAEIKSNKKEIRKLNNRIDKLSKRNESLHELNEEILNSTSWKVTKPLRKAGSILKK